jgi:hypothetical protein
VPFTDNLPITKKMSTTRTKAAAAALAASLLLVASGPAASAKSGEVIRRGRCTGASTWKLKVKPDNGRIEAEFEVDQNRNGVRWIVLMGDNGVRVFTGSAVTVAPSGSFEVARRIPNRAGADNIVARATNPATGEVCRGTATL